MTSTTSPRLKGASNFRDFGGHRTANGQRVRSGVLYRSNDLHGLTEPDFAALRPLGIRLICDLRGNGERKCRPSRWPEDVAVERLLAERPAPSADEPAHFESEQMYLDSVDSARQVLIDLYGRLPMNSAITLRTLVTRLVDGELPVVVHCTAGKDRTGFLCAALQHALGVPRETILADYLLTNERLDLDEMVETLASLREAMPKLPTNLPRPVLDVINSVDTVYLEAAYASVAQRYGSMDGYLRDVGIDAALQQQLRERLLES